MVVRFPRRSSVPNRRGSIYREKISRKNSCDEFLIAMHETTLQLLADRLSSMNNSNQDEDHDNINSGGYEDSWLLNALNEDIHNLDYNDGEQLPIDLLSYFGEGSFEENCIVDLDDFCSIETRKDYWNDCGSYASENYSITSYSSGKKEICDSIAKEIPAEAETITFPQDAPIASRKETIDKELSSKSNRTKCTDSITEVEMGSIIGIPTSVFLLKGRLDRHDKFYSNPRHESTRNRNEPTRETIMDIYSKQMVSINGSGTGETSSLNSSIKEQKLKSLLGRIFSRPSIKRNPTTCTKEKTLLQI